MSARRPHMRGVSVRAHRGKHGTTYYGRYTMRDGSRPSVPPSDTWDEAFEKAAAEQRKVNRCGYRDTRNGRITFEQLVIEQWLPTQTERGLNTQSNHDSHLGNIDGKPVRKGGKAERAAKYGLLAWFGRLRIMDIEPQDIRQWQAGMLADGYKRASIKAKRGLLKSILDFAVNEGWIDLNPVLAVKEPVRLLSGWDHEQVLDRAAAGWLTRDRWSGTPWIDLRRWPSKAVMSSTGPPGSITGASAGHAAAGFRGQRRLSSRHRALASEPRPKCWLRTLATMSKQASRVTINASSAKRNSSAASLSCGSCNSRWARSRAPPSSPLAPGLRSQPIFADPEAARPSDAPGDASMG